MNQVLNDTIRILLSQKPDAQAEVRGSKEFSDIMCEVMFYPLWRGTLVVASISGLPQSAEHCRGGFYGFHIHSGNRCTGNQEDPFADTGMHWNTTHCDHPGHSGDFPVLMGNDGYAMEAFYTDHFYPEEVIGKTVIIHEMPDDYRAQPSGNSGRKIACGQIISGK